MSNPIVSIIVPVYNTAKYLPRCLESLLNQTLVGVEIICINDGSTDNSEKVLKNYAKKDKRIVVINQKNGGSAAARNAGLKAAKGTYIGFIDSDDYAEANMYEVMVTEAKIVVRMLLFVERIFIQRNQRADSGYMTLLVRLERYMTVYDAKTLLFGCSYQQFFMENINTQTGYPG